MIGMRITGKKLGILGMGRIGQAIAKRARAFDLNINYHNRRRLHKNIEKSLSATFWENLEEMLSVEILGKAVLRLLIIKSFFEVIDVSTTKPSSSCMSKLF